ncbi:MAG: Fic family protein [Xanthomonadales bacterium]|nr:Fic family protein [Xanthomonadales bacterium]MDZ4116927.1 Fic family protein [Xanthomonadaceae bacterium]
MRVLSMALPLPRWPRTTPAHSFFGRGWDDRFAGLASAAARAFQSRKIQRRELIDLNALILGKPQAGFRTGPVWIEAPHPALSSHVGSPAPRLDALVDAILTMVRRPWPTTLIAMVSLVRLLQVHPFFDGNGRTARLYACWLVRRRLGPSPLFLRLLDVLWNRAEFSILGASVAIRDRDDWSPILEYCLATTARGWAFD